MSADNATVKNSTVINENSNMTNTATGGSKINTGIAADNSTINNSKITNVNKDMTIKAEQGATVNTGLNLENATIKDAKISQSNTKVSNTATGSGSKANSGVDLGGN